ncbi:MAG: Omp28-related outer membrane protein [Chitinophagales bacterium]|nr:Omp28-related outer membrane protein [Chitinophagales bacterium]
MKGKLLLLIPILALLFAACEESGPNIVLKDKVVLVDTTYTVATIESPQTRNTLVEEFTGVRCTNCPQGHEKAKEIHDVWGNRFLFVSYHSNFLDDPYPFSPVDMGSDEAQAMDIFLGPAPAKPAAAIDRKLFPGETALVHLLQKWSAFVQEQLDNHPTPVNIHVNTDFDPVSKELIVNVRLHYTEAVSEDNKVSIMLIENGIIAPQLDGPDIDTFYVHDEVFRAFVTETRGNQLISPDKNAGREFVKEFLFDDFGDDWNIANMEIFAFVHKNDVDKEIYHAVHADF